MESRKLEKCEHATGIAINNTQEESPLKNLEELQKKWTEADIRASRGTMHIHFQARSYSCHIPDIKPVLNQGQQQKQLTWAEEKKTCTVAQWSKVFF